MNKDLLVNSTSTDIVTLSPIAERLYSSDFDDNTTRDFIRIAEEYLKNTHFMSGPRKNILLFFFLLINIFGTVGNVLFCIIYIRKKIYKDPKCWLLINLSISDMMICIICMPFSILKLTRNDWAMGEFMCKVVPFLQSLHIFASSQTIMAIAIIRYMNVVKNCQWITEKLSVAVVLVTIWLISAACSIPMFIYHHIQQIYIHGKIFHYPVCLENWGPAEWRQRYVLSVFILQFLIPFSVICLFSILICNFLRLRLSTQICYRGILNYKLIRTQKNAYLLSAVTITYAMTWLPLAVINLIIDFYPYILKQIDGKDLQVIFASMLLISMTSTVINPVLYGWFNNKFRRAILALLMPQRNTKYRR